MIWDEPELSRLAMHNAPALPLDRVRDIAAWCEKRCSETQVANPTALLVACLKSAASQPPREPRPAPTAYVQHWRVNPMREDDWNASEQARIACLPELRRIFGQDFGSDDLRGSA